MKNKIEINLYGPTSWKELSPGQLKYAAWLLSQADMTAEEIWAYAFVRFTNIHVVKVYDGETKFRHKWKMFLLSEQECFSFAKEFSFLTEGVEEIAPLKKLARLKASDARLRGCTFAQYIACENYYQAYLFTKKEEYLNMLCASFYIKKQFDDSSTEKMAKRFAKLSFHIRYTVFIWFTGFKKVLKNNFKNYFVEIESGEDNQRTPPNMRKQIEQMMRALSAGDVTKVKDIWQVETWTALSELDAKALEYKTMKSKMKK